MQGRVLAGMPMPAGEGVRGGVRRAAAVSICAGAGRHAQGGRAGAHAGRGPRTLSPVLAGCYDADVSWLLWLYLLGVLIGLWRVDAAWPRRAFIAAAWPIGVLAALVTTPILVGAALVLFPLLGAALVMGVVVWRIVIGE